ncbi:hypothetical protein SAMN05216223_103111 [Actinacidiphila yanglinensis]|uniref:EcsC protein family protein n=1 Tax=Actinacidiphila yanglinensis TaxID=310779 RepID=A0A1H5X6U7_9ACTN|nr:hypothetical protein [Actinacidiphila yanglinensis]SEG07107.1 hypothetical protein SAMN05216223_103111 [Actinacidiphila yanglinensis]
MSGSPEERRNVERGRAASLAAASVHGVTRGVGGGARAGGRLAKVGIGSVAERLVESAPRIPVRGLDTLRAQFPGLGPDEIADRLIAAAVKGTMTVGAGVGAAAMLPTPPAMPAELAAETLGVAAVEYKLIAELHEVYGLRVPGTARERATAYLWSWTEQRGIDALKLSTLNVALGTSMKREMRQRLLRRTLRHTPSLTPFMIGAAVGALMNRRDTRKLARRVRKDLRAHQLPWPLIVESAELSGEAGHPGSSEPPGPVQE